MQALLKGRQWLTVAVLAILLVAAVIGALLTRNALVSDTTATRGHLPPIVDETPLQTAQAMAKLSSSWDEQRFANQVLRLSDHEVDLAFADALRDASNHPAHPTPQTQALYTRLTKAQAQANEDQKQIDGLKTKLASAPAAHKDELQEQLDLAQAQLELDQDELDGAHTDLIRAGVDKLSRVQRQFQRHEDTEHAGEASHATNSPSALPINYQSETLWGQIQALRALRSKISALRSALDESTNVANTLTSAHATLQQQFAADKSAETAPSQANPTNSEPISPAIAKLTVLKTLSNDQKTLADLSKRIQDVDGAQTAYTNWIALVRSHQLVAVHNMIESALWILLIVLVAYIADRLIDRYFSGISGEFTRLHTLRAVIRFAIQVACILLILVVALGVPQQTPTILGFAGAGLTVALKDFIVGFFGWFVLMGKNGLRVGDWVEINGVAGEVIEINLLRTVLLETGNWAPTGHPTGRKVSFVNSYAIEGHFFNFTTSGQWLWDELQYTLPADQDPYRLVEAIQKTIMQETGANVRTAEEEWQRLSQRYRVRSVSAAPSVNVQPSGSGLEVHIRYITRAHERYAMRSRLNQAIVQLLQHGTASEEQTAAAGRKGD